MCCTTLRSDVCTRTSRPKDAHSSDLQSACQLWRRAVSYEVAATVTVCQTTFLRFAHYLQSSAPRVQSVLLVGWSQCSELVLYCFCRVFIAGTQLSSQPVFDDGGQPKVTRSLVGTVGGMEQNPDVLLMQQGHSDLGFVGTDVIMKEKSC